MQDLTPNSIGGHSISKETTLLFDMLDLADRYVEREPSMCDDASEPREWRFHIRDMITFSENVLSYSSGMNQDEFLVGEAATHIPSEVRAAHQEIPWRAIIGTRNRLAHAYLSIDNMIIWSVIREAVPALVPALRNLLAETEKDYP